MGYKHYSWRLRWGWGHCFDTKKTPSAGSVISVNMISQHQVPNMLPITFTTKDFKAIDPVKDDPMVISVEIANSIVKKTLVD